MASNSGWTFGLPSGQSKVSNTDEEFRSLKSYVERWIEQEHYVTGGSSASAGVHRLGSARIYSGPASQLSNPTGDGGNRLFFTTDTERLYVAQASSSSWSLASENVQTTSANSWSALQEFSDIAVTNHIAGIASYVTKLGADVGVAAGSQTVSVLTTTQNLFTLGDFLIASYESLTNGGVLVTSPRVVTSDISQLALYVYNGGASRNTIPSGTTVRVLGFKHAV